MGHPHCGPDLCVNLANPDAVKKTSNSYLKASNEIVLCHW